MNNVYTTIGIRPIIVGRSSGTGGEIIPCEITGISGRKLPLNAACRAPLQTELTRSKHPIYR